MNNDYHYVLCAPLASNIPNPGNRDWAPMLCPACGRKCWNPVTEEMKSVLPKDAPTLILCTECALKHSFEIEAE